jgi:hypothetical protein
LCDIATGGIVAKPPQPPANGFHPYGMSRPVRRQFYELHNNNAMKRRRRAQRTQRVCSPLSAAGVATRRSEYDAAGRRADKHHPNMEGSQPVAGGRAKRHHRLLGVRPFHEPGGFAAPSQFAIPPPNSYAITHKLHSFRVRR